MYQDEMAEIYPELFKDENTLVHQVTFQVTDACNLACTYCYQINKGVRRMKLETAKKLIDMLLHDDPRLNGYVDRKNSPGIVFEFIGGEPLLEAKLIEDIIDYFLDEAIKMRHPWAKICRFSICSNGTLYFEEDAQHLLTKYQDKISFSVTIDGNKELHDACRLFPDGSPSYDKAVAAAKDWMNKGYYMGSKITIAPGNLDYMNEAIIHMVDLGYEEIMANTVFEEGWTQEHAKTFYWKLKEIADYWNDHDIVESHYLSLFDEEFFGPMDPEDNDNWCFRAGTQVRTEVGYKLIEDLEIGDKLLSWNPFEEKYVITKVMVIMKRLGKDPLKLDVYGCDTIYTTGRHPIYARVRDTDSQIEEYKSEDFVLAKNLKVGDLVATYSTGTIEWNPILEIDTSIEPYIVYDVTTTRPHTFIANDVIVHNCGGTGNMLSMDPDGWLYPCIRYMESSLGTDQPPLRIGHVDYGIGEKECDKQCIDCLNAITRRSQSTDECFNCPIAHGCAWCSGYNYQIFGTANKRATYICEMHKARSLANYYFWNTYYRKHGIEKRKEVYCPKEWAIPLIGEEEYNMLLELAKED